MSDYSTSQKPFSHDVTIQQIHEWSKIDLFFLVKLEKVIAFENVLKEEIHNVEVLQEAKEMGFADCTIAKLWNQTEREVYDFRKQNGVMPVYKTVDTCAKRI